METGSKRLNRQQKKDKVFKDLINQMFIIAGHNVTYDDIVEVDQWFNKYSMTVEQDEEFKAWGKRYLMKTLRMRATIAEKEMRWFSMQWGLAHSNFEEYYNLNKK